MHASVCVLVCVAHIYSASRFSRVHGRFACPVLVVDGKNICRSATIAIQAETLLHNVTVKTAQLLGSLCVCFYFKWVGDLGNLDFVS